MKPEEYMQYAQNAGGACTAVTFGTVTGNTIREGSPTTVIIPLIGSSPFTYDEGNSTLPDFVDSFAIVGSQVELSVSSAGPQGTYPIVVAVSNCEGANENSLPFNFVSTP